MNIQLLGHGAVATRFLQLFSNDFADVTFQVFMRNPEKHINQRNMSFHHLRDYTSDAITLCCLSVNEEALLKTSSSSSRLTVALPNLKLITQFIEAGYFNSGTHFILTNPSELIAEYIFRQTGNQQIYALGLSVDQSRYQSILPSFGISPLHARFDVIGNHYQSPIIQFQQDQQYNTDLVHELMHALAVKTRSEFQGYKPPVSGGVVALFDIVSSIHHQTEIMLSGYSSQYDAVTGGIFNSGLQKFHLPVIHTLTADLHLHAIKTHHENYQHISSQLS